MRLPFFFSLSDNKPTIIFILELRKWALFSFLGASLPFKDRLMFVSNF